MSSVVSWADVPESALASIISAEQARWRDMLHWDTSDLWAALRSARLDRRLEGAVTLSDAGVVNGYSYWANRQDEIQCGALTSVSADGTRSLVDALLSASAVLRSVRVRIFALVAAPGADEILGAYRFNVRPYGYLAAPSRPLHPWRPTGRSWDIRDLDATADLLRASYGPADPDRPFAPGGTMAEWRQYVNDLVLGHGCGRLRSSLSIAVPGAYGSLDGVAIVTDIGESTAHLAQLAVHPTRQGSGVAGRIVAAIRGRCAEAGYGRVTLLVREGNRAAEQLYAHQGFERCASFTSAVCAVAHATPA